MTAPLLVSGAIVAGRYGIQSLLDHAGSIATYHAITAPHREVALKLYDPALKSFPEVMKTLSRYQTVTSSLPGNSILPILDSGEDAETGAPYSVTDFEANPSLAQLVELCPLSPPEMIALVRSLARGIDLLHANGIAHLSLRPSNVFVGPAPAFETRVADYGMNLVRRALPVADRQASWVPWLAPEQVDDTATPGAPADVFALALVAFFAIAGKSYWRSCAAGAVDIAAWKREIAGPRATASERARDLSVALGQTFDGVFARALAGTPKDRFTTAGQFASALQAAASLHATVGGVAPTAAPNPGAPMAKGPLQDVTAPHAKKHRATMVGLGAPEVSHVPPPPAQLEAVLATFEAPASPEAPSSAARPEFPAAAPAETQEPIEIPGVYTRPVARRPRLAWALGIGAAVVGMLGTFLIVRRPAPKTEQTSNLESSSAALGSPSESPRPGSNEIVDRGAASAIAQTEPLPSSAPEPPVASSAVPEAPPAAETAPVGKPARAPVWRKKPTPPMTAPQKKPCGKFLKRCN